MTTPSLPPQIPPYEEPNKLMPMVTPFTIRDGITMLKKVDYIVRYIQRVLIPWVQENYDDLAQAFEDQANALIETVNTALATEHDFVTTAIGDLGGKSVEQAIDDLTQFVNDSIAAIINNSVTVQDPVMAGIMGNPASQTRIVTDNLYANDSDLSALTTTVNSNKVSAGTRLWDRSKIFCIGDSLTAGGQETSGVSFPSFLAGALPDCTVTNIGLSGYASGDVAAKWGVPFVLATFTVPSGTSPVNVSVKSPADGFRTSSPIFPTWVGELRFGSTVIPGTLAHTIDSGATVPNGWTFTRTSNGATTSVPDNATFVCTEQANKNGFLIINVGRNDDMTKPQVILRNINAIIANHSAPIDSVIVLPIPYTTSEGAGTLAYQQVKTVNKALKDTFREQFCDDMNFLRVKGLTVNGLSPTTTDLSGILFNQSPSALMFDSVHPNSNGYRARAVKILDFLTRKGVYGRINSVSGVATNFMGALHWEPSDSDMPQGQNVATLIDTQYGVPFNRDSSMTNYPIFQYDPLAYDYLQFPGNAFMEASLNGGAAITVPAPYIVVAKIRISNNAQTNGIMWGKTAPSDTFLITTTSKLSFNGVSSTSVAVPLNTWVWVYAIVGATSTIVWCQNVSSETITVNSNGIKDAVRVAYAFSGSAIGGVIDVARYAIWPGTWDHNRAIQLMSLIERKRILTGE